MDGEALNSVGAQVESNERALRRVLETYGPALRRMATSWTRTAAERDDLMQDIALALLTSLPSFRGDCPERAFVWRVAQHRAYRFASTRKRHAQHDDVDETQPSLTPSPHDVLAQRERIDRLHRALRTLREDQRMVVVLALEGMSHDDIAIVVGGTANAVGVRLHRARTALQLAISQLEPVQRSTP